MQACISKLSLNTERIFLYHIISLFKCMHYLDLYYFSWRTNTAVLAKTPDLIVMVYISSQGRKTPGGGTRDVDIPPDHVLIIYIYLKSSSSYWGQFILGPFIFFNFPILLIN